VSQLTLWTRDHPSAGGRQPLPGEQSYQFTLPLEDGRTLYLLVGQQGYESLRDMLTESAADDAKESAHE
jgi:hypothetical protein